MKLVLIAVCLLVTACTPSVRNVQIQTANAVAVAANNAAPLIIAEYHRQGVKCIDDAATRIDADTCLIKLDSKWTKVKLAWSLMRQTQAEWADALKRSDPKIADYITYMTQAFCDLKNDVPTLPEIQGISCE